MKLSTSGLSQQQSQEGGEKKCLNSELWHACAGPLVSLPTVGSRVVYFPQGHSEQVVATTNKEVDGHIPNYPNLPAQLICQLHNVTMHADVETDEVYAQMTLQPLTPEEQKDTFLPMELGMPSKQPTNYFCKTLTASDTSTHGGFSVPRRAAEKVFPPLDFSQQPPAQELIARDLHDVEWKFRHIFRGQPKRHLLTTGWSVFVSAKRLVAGDSVLFIWNEKNQLLLGIRRATRPQTVMPSSVLSSDSMHIGLLAAAAHAAATNSCFTVFYNPRASPCEFVIPLSKYVKAVYHTRISVGMRFRMLFETEESSVRRYMGTITGISDLDAVRWPNSHWRSVKVGWDESTAGERQPRVSLWEIEPLTTFPMYPSLFPFRLKRPWHPGSSSFPDSRDENGNNLMWLRGGGAGDGLPPMNFQAVNMLPWMQQRVDPSLLRNDNNQWYQAMLAASLQSSGGIGGDPMRQQFMQLQQQPLQYQQQSSINYPIFTSPSQVPTDGLSQQQIGTQPENHSQQPEPSYHESLLGGQPSLNSPSFAKTDFVDPNSKFVGSTSTIQNMLGSGNLLDLTRTGQPSSMTQQLNHEPWAPHLYPDKDPGTKPGNGGGNEAHSPNNFGMNIESSGLLLPTTVRRVVATTSSSDPDVSSMPLSEPGFQNYLYQQDSSEFLPGTGQLDSLEAGPIFVKVYKSGSVGRSLDISRFSNYLELREELAQMFGIEGKLENPHRSGWQLVFVDKENDVLLLGDGPWESFVNNVWYIKILSPDDVVKMGQPGVESFSPNPSQRTISSGAPDLASGSFGY